MYAAARTGVSPGGRLAIGDGRWAMGDWRWAMGDGRLAIGDGRLAILGEAFLLNGRFEQTI
jgi:hypothetical protein